MDKITGRRVPRLECDERLHRSATPTTIYASFFGGGTFKINERGRGDADLDEARRGHPSDDFSRMPLGISPSSPQTYSTLITGLWNDVDLAYSSNRSSVHRRWTGT